MGRGTIDVNDNRYVTVSGIQPVGSRLEQFHLLQQLGSDALPTGAGKGQSGVRQVDEPGGVVRDLVQSLSEFALFIGEVNGMRCK